MFKNMEADFNLIENELKDLDLGLIQDSSMEGEMENKNGSNTSKQSTKTHLSSKNLYCISNTQNMEIVESTKVNIDHIESPSKEDNTITNFFDFQEHQEV